MATCHCCRQVMSFDSALSLCLFAYAVRLCHLFPPTGCAICLCAQVVPFASAIRLCRLLLRSGCALCFRAQVVPFASALRLCHMILLLGRAYLLVHSGCAICCLPQVVLFDSTLTLCHLLLPSIGISPSSVAEPEPQGAETFGRSRSWSRYLKFRFRFRLWVK
jgi:hypothetical protein